MWEWEAGSVDARRSKPGGGQSPLAARGTPDLTPVSCVSAYNPLTPNVWVYTSQQLLLQLSGHQRNVLKCTCDTKYQSCCRLRDCPLLLTLVRGPASHASGQLVGTQGSHDVGMTHKTQNCSWFIL